MDRRKFVTIMGVGAAAAIPAGAGLALGAPPAPTPDYSQSTVTYQPDGSLVIVGRILYNQALQGYVVQALVPGGVHGQYFITNPNDKVLGRLAKTGTIVTVQGRLDHDAMLLLLQTINGKPY